MANTPPSLTIELTLILGIELVNSTGILLIFYKINRDDSGHVISHVIILTIGLELS